MAIEADFPLFPLGMVALPQEAVPLHIFEERYQEMIAYCLENEVEFGIVWAAEDGLRTVGCAVEIEEILETMPDGRMDIVCRGTRPFELLSRTEIHSYPSGEVEFLEDSEGSGDLSDDGARQVYAELYLAATEREIDEAELSNMSSYEMASTVEFGPDAKQTLLELRDEGARLRLLASLFKAALKRVDEVGKVEALARSNGKVRFGRFA
jgi:Lon protease-like protein